MTDNRDQDLSLKALFIYVQCFEATQFQGGQETTITGDHHNQPKANTNYQSTKRLKSTRQNPRPTTIVINLGTLPKSADRTLHCMETTSREQMSDVPRED